jgi:hypothetical protein
MSVGTDVIVSSLGKVNLRFGRVARSTGSGICCTTTEFNLADKRVAEGKSV